jgi:hypothetical protein
MKIDFKKITNVEIENIQMFDYPDFCDAHFSHAVYQDTREPLTDDELDELGDLYPEVIGEMAFEHCM